MSTSTSYDDVLCPELYFKLKKLFGQVHVNNRGVGMVMRPSSNGERPTSIVNGEYYRVCCPFCKETRHRLYINHRWFEYRHMANCFNETACTRGELGKLNLDQLHMWLFNTSSKITLSVVDKPMSSEFIASLTEFRAPERLTRLSELSRDHDAIKYVESRGYNSAILDKYLGVGWIDDMAIPTLKERLYIPIFQGPKLMGYQARIIYDDPLKKKQKYMNPVGMKKSTLLYNIDNAKLQPMVVVCEGPIDVWSIGPAGIAIFGSDCSGSQLALIGENFNGKPIVIALDGDVAYKAESLVDKLQQAAPRSKIIRPRMEKHEDPGTLRMELWRRLQSHFQDIGETMPDVSKEWPNE